MSRVLIQEQTAQVHAWSLGLVYFVQSPRLLIGTKSCDSETHPTSSCHRVMSVHSLRKAGTLPQRAEIGAIVQDTWARHHLRHRHYPLFLLELSACKLWLTAGAAYSPITRLQCTTYRHICPFSFPVTDSKIRLPPFRTPLYATSSLADL